MSGFPKILMPFIVHDGINIHSDKTFGGIERFKKLVYTHVPNVVPVDIIKDKNTKRYDISALNFEMWTNRPDIIFINDMQKTFGSNLIKYDLPIVWLCHEGLSRSIMMVDLLVNRFNEFTNSGGHLYFVSQNQHEFLDANSIRLTGKPIKNVRGYINSACCTGNESVYTSNREFDAITIGRNDSSKDPFWIHRKLKETSLSSAVITGTNIYQSDQEKKYAEKNLNWKEPQYTFKNLSYDQTMFTMSKARTYISTCTFESWGITALEALSHGLPIVLVTDNSGKHSSETIAASSDHYRKVSKDVSSSELKKILGEMNELSLTDRQNIAKMTQEKHSLENFKNRMNQIFADVL